MKWLIRLLLPLSLATTSLQSAPSSIVGRWKIGDLFEDMAPQPVGLSNHQMGMLVGQSILVGRTSIIACRKRIPFEFVAQESYSAETFLQKYGISPAQIGLDSPVTELSFTFPPPRTVCGNAEGFEILTDGRHAALEDGNAYFRLFRVETPPH